MRQPTSDLEHMATHGGSGGNGGYNGGSSAGGLEVLSLPDLVSEARAVGLERIHILAWRDLDDPEAGGSELHAHRIASIWAAAGLDVTMRTSAAAGHSHFVERAGYKVLRKSGRYAVFPRTALSEIGLGRFGTLGRLGHPKEPGHGSKDGLVEIWNGMPFFSPVWATGPRIVFLHHVHAEMWQLSLTPRLAKLGRFVEERVAPPLYRHTKIVTLSASSREEIVSMLGIPAGNVSVVAPGVEPQFSPGATKSEHPLVVAVGRLVPVKRFCALIDALAKVRVDHPDMRAVIVGEGYERSRLEQRRRELDAESWLDLPGKLSDAELVDMYRRAWVLVSASLREGWGMTVTEAASCGTPAVVTRIAGHEDAVVDGKTGILVPDPAAIAGATSELLLDPMALDQLARGAREHAAKFNWRNTATGTLAQLVSEARRHRERHQT